MAPTLTNEIRETNTPTHCSGCFQQDSKLRYVDFDAACDRGYGDAHGVQIAMEDLILCENCLRDGAKLVGMEDARVLGERLASVAARLDEETARCEQAANYANRMEEALAARPTPIKVSRPRGRPRRQATEEPQNA
jgi:hypothetical protein